MRVEESEIEAPPVGDPFYLHQVRLQRRMILSQLCLKTGAVGMAIFGK